MSNLQRNRLFLLIISFFCFLSFSTISHGSEVHLSVAASMTDAVKEIIAAYKQAAPAHQVRANFASSGSLAKQITQGAPADIYISANPRWMDYLIEQGLITSGSRKTFAYNSLVFISSRTTPPKSLDDISTFERIAIGNPKSVPAGQYARQAMRRANIYSSMKNSKKLIFAKDVRQALLYADRGEVDGAFVYKTDAMLARNAPVSFSVPAKLHDRVVYPIGLTPTGKSNEPAKMLFQFMQTKEAKVILEKHGFTTSNK